MKEDKRGLPERSWDSVKEILSHRLPYWLRKPRAVVFPAPDLSAHRDKATLDLFPKEKRRKK